MSAATPSCPHCRTSIHEAEVNLTTCPACGAPLPRPSRVRTNRLLVGGVLSSLALVGIAAAVMVARQDRPQPSSSPGAPALLDSSEPGGPVPSLLLITVPAEGSASPAVVSLGAARYHDSTPGGTDESIMAHEVVRQAVLFAARDLGAVVRDQTIGDPVPGAFAGAVPPEIEVGSLFVSGRVPVAVLARRGAGGRELIATFELGGPMARYIDYPTLVERAEALSRSEDGFRKVLKTIGLKPTPAAKQQGDRPGEEVETRLARMTFTEPFAALRLLHDEIRNKGESPDRLGALVRGYANLGALTDFHWGAGAKAFKARALLAGQRLVATDPRSPRASWHRAYARALVGYHKDALDDLEKASKLAGAEKAPSWVALVDALCRFQTGKLVEAGEGPDPQLALFLAFLTAEHPAASTTHAVNLGRELLLKNPECYRIYDTMSNLGGVSLWHWSTVAGLQAFTEAIPSRLIDLPGLPDPVAAKLREGAGEADVERALASAGRDAGDRGEPSWGSLGRMVMDGRFALLIRRANFFAWGLSVPAGDFVAEMRPLIIDHPHLPFFDSYGVDRLSEARKFGELIKQVDIPDVDFIEELFVQVVAQADHERHKKLVVRMICHGDTFYHDLALMIKRWLKQDGIAEGAKHIEKISPYAPLARAQLINADWDYAKPHAREWEADAISANQPDVLSFLGLRYIEEKKWADAERCLSKAVELSPDVETLESLAKVYKGQDKIEPWLATLERALQAEDQGLHHMSIRVSIANYYMEKEQYDKALPYAEAAAETWANSGMNCARICHERMGHWQEAELWMRRSSERYPQSDWMYWYLWCRRTGHGDVASARAFVIDTFAGYGDQAADGPREWFGIFHILDGSPRKALEILLPLQEKSPAATRAFMIASQADQIGDVALRDRALAGFDSIPQIGQWKLEKLLKVLREGLAAGKIDHKATLEALKEIPKPSRYFVGVFVGHLIHAHGSPEFARDLLLRCDEMMGDVGWLQAVANVSLREWEKPAK